MKNSDDLPDFDKLALSLEGVKEPVEVLDAAQQLELSAKRLYEKLEQGTKNQSMKSLFSFLAREEQRHYDLLASWKSHLNGEAKAPVIDERITGEVWDRGGRLNEFTDSEQEALLAAQRAENTSYRFYKKMADRHISGLLGSTFRGLAEREKLHFELVEWMFGEEIRFRLET